MVMFTVLIIFTILTTTTSKMTQQFQFPDSKEFPYAKLRGTIPYDLLDFTLCQWTRMNKSPGGWVTFSYAVPSSDNHLTTSITENQHAQLWRHNPTPKVKTDYAKWKWLHTCFTWTSVEGMWQIFANGVKIQFGSNINANSSVLANGVVILGQDQDKLEGGFEYDAAFKGQISEVHLWNYILTPSDILKAYSCSPETEGNVISWQRDAWILRNGVQSSPVNLPCGLEQ